VRRTDKELSLNLVMLGLIRQVDSPQALSLKPLSLSYHATYAVNRLAGLIGQRQILRVAGVKEGRDEKNR